MCDYPPTIQGPTTIKGDLTVNGRLFVDSDQPCIVFQDTVNGRGAWGIGLDMVSPDGVLMDLTISKVYSFQVSDAKLVEGSTILTSQQANFADECLADGGYTVTADGLAPGTKIISWEDSSHATMSQPALKTCKPQWCSFSNPTRFCNDSVYIRHNGFSPAQFNFNQPGGLRDDVVMVIGANPGKPGQDAIRVIDQTRKVTLRVPQSGRFSCSRKLCLSE